MQFSWQKGFDIALILTGRIGYGAAQCPSVIAPFAVTKRSGYKCTHCTESSRQERTARCRRRAAEGCNKQSALHQAPQPRQPHRVSPTSVSATNPQSPYSYQSSPSSSAGCCVRSEPLPQPRASLEQYLSQPQQMRSGCLGWRGKVFATGCALRATNG